MDRNLKQLLVSSLHNFVQKAEDKPNDLVQQAFETKYAEALYPNWSSSETDKWRVDFSWKKKEHFAHFDTNGLWLETRVMTLFDALPKLVKKSFKKSYVRGKEIKITHIVTPNEDLFEIECRNGSKTLRLFYDYEGKLLKNSTLII